MRSYAIEGIADEVRAAGGEIYAVSSEPQELATRAKKDWGLDFETVGDPHQEIADTLRDRGVLDLFVNTRLGFLKGSSAEFGSDFEPTHPKGYFQPGVVALRQDGRVLYRWRGVPTHKNMGGATERPTAEHVWQQAAAALTDGASTQDAALDEDPPLDQRGVPWPIFSTLLIANGWFLKPVGFRGVRYIAIAALRLVAFVAAWIAAFAWLPTLPVAAALAAWVAYIIPKYRWVGLEFQDATSGSA